MSWLIQLPEEILNLIMEELLQQFWENRSYFPRPGLSTSPDLHSVSLTCSALRRLSLPLMSQGASLYFGPPPRYQPAAYSRYHNSFGRFELESDTSLSHLGELYRWASLVNVSVIR